MNLSGGISVRMVTLFLNVPAWCAGSSTSTTPCVGKQATGIGGALSRRDTQKLYLYSFQSIRQQDSDAPRPWLLGKPLPLVDRERLLAGNWKIKPTAGKVFNRSWFEIVDAVPAGGRTVRFWDLAATEKAMDQPDPDFTAGVKMRRVGDVYYVMDAQAEQEAPGRVDTMIKNTATQDGVSVAIRWNGKAALPACVIRAIPSQCWRASTSAPCRRKVTR